MGGRVLTAALALLVAFGGGGTPSGAADERPHRHEHRQAAAETADADVPAAEFGARPLLLIGVYSVLIVLGSLAGGWLPFVMHLTHTRMQLIMSFVAGLMLGIGLFHMLPHAYAENGSLDRSVEWAMIGLLTMFFLIRAFHFHQHGAVELLDGPNCPHDHDHDHGLVSLGAPAAAHGAGPAHHHGHHHHHGAPHRLSWVGVALGLALHTLIDGVALAASVSAEVGHETLWSLWGAGTFLAILLHKPLDAVSITSLMTASGWSAPWRHAVNAGFSLMCPLGAALFLVGVDLLGSHQHFAIGCALAFAAGVFLCISLGDLLPEVEFHTHDRMALSLALLLGVALAYGIGFLEPAHAHGPHTHHDHGHAALEWMLSPGSR